MVGAALYLRLGRGAAPGLVLLAVLAESWLAAILAGALILAPPEAPPLAMAIATPLVIWAGFVLPALAVTGSYRGHGARTVALDCLHWLAVMFTQALVLRAIGLVAP